MKTIELKSLTLQNWRGQNIKIVFNDDTTVIKGKNGKGKTSIMSAWFWLLSSYTDTVLPKNSNLFDDKLPLTKDTPKAVVIAEVKTENGLWTLKREVLASFRFNTSTSEWEKQSSDKYTYKIDDIEVTATDYSNWISTNICAFDMLTYCLSGSFFSALALEDKKQARKTLERIAGEIVETDFNGDYTSLEPWFKKGYKIDEIVLSMKAKQKNINKRLIEIPAMIEGKESFVAECMRTDFNLIESQIAECKKELSELDNVLSMNADGEKKIREERDAIQVKINEEMDKLYSLRVCYNSSFKEKESELLQEIAKVERENNEIIDRNNKRALERTRVKESIVSETERLAMLEEEREKLLKERDEVKSMVFSEDKCPTCNQDMPLDMLEKLEVAFCKKKAESLEAIVTKGKFNAKQINESKKRIEELKTQFEEMAEDEGLKDLRTPKERYATHQASHIPFESTKECKAIVEKVNKLNGEMPKCTVDSSEIIIKRKAIIETFEGLTTKLGIKKLMDEALVQIASLKEERKNLGVEFTMIESVLQKCKEYEEERADITSYKINESLEKCMIRMWERQKNGELVPSCTIVSSEGVKLTTINHSMRVLIESEIQRLFCTKFGIRLPIFFDEASIFDSEHTPKIDGWQVILLKASDDPYLIVE